MVSKKNIKVLNEKSRDEKQRFSIRKLSVGAASVLIGLSFMAFNGQSVSAATDGTSTQDNSAQTVTGSETTEAPSNNNEDNNKAATEATSAKTDNSVSTQADESKNEVKSETAEAASSQQNKSVNKGETVQEKKADQQTDSSEKTDKATKAESETEKSNDTTTEAKDVKINNEKNAKNADKAKLADRKLSLVATAEAEDPNATTVNTAQEFIDAIQKGTATTINVAKDINLADTKKDSTYTETSINHKRDIVIQSNDPGEKRTIDFSGYSFDMNTQNSVTFKDLNIYARSFWGLVYNAGGYTFDNVDFTGSQLIYTKPSINSTLIFKNTVNANSVSTYVGPLDQKTRPTQQAGGQQILQFEGGTNQIIFDKNSNVTLTTEDANALEIDGGTTTIDVKDGANVSINPHSKGNPEDRKGVGSGTIARAIAANAKMTINIDPNATLTINTEKVGSDKDVAGALYLKSDATLNVNGKLAINSKGTPSASKNNGVPVYINGNANISVGNGGSFVLDATNLGDYSSSLISVNGKGSVNLAPHSNFKMSADGTGGLTAISLSSGSTFTSDQPDSFTIDLSQNKSTSKSLIKNGTISFTRVKTVGTDGTTSEPLGKIDVTYDKNGNATSYTITALDEDTVNSVAAGLTNKNLIDLVKAGEDVTLSNLHLSKNNVLTGTVASSGSNNPIYVTVTVGGVSTNVPVLGHYTVYTNTNGKVTSDNVDYAAQTASTGGNFSIDLSKLASSLTDDAQVAVTATKDFVESAQTESVAALRALNTTTLKELVDAASEEEKKPSYYNATAEAQKAYTDAISTGKTILANPNNYDQVDVDDAVTAIQKAQKALTGEPTNKTELQQAVGQASSVESGDNYTNADSNFQKAYTDAISAGQNVLNNENATQTEVDNALTAINNAKAALNGDTKKDASKEALQQAVNAAPTVRTDDATYYNGTEEAKKAYDDAISAGQTVLGNPDATATQITDALNTINTAKNNLDGKETNKSTLQTAVNNSTTIKESNNYTNADEIQKTAYDNAITAAQKVLDNTNATQAEVNEALQNLETANNNLNGDAKTEAANKAALEAAVKEAPTVRETPAYYNGSSEAQTAYNSAISAGQAVLDKENPTASEVKDALDAINAAKSNLKGEVTNTETLETALTNANNAKDTGNYTNADQAKQEALTNAINAGQEVLKNTNATQTEVDNAVKAITDAINGLNGDTNLANAKTAATEDIQKALDSKTTEITDATNIDQTTKDQLIKEATEAANNAKEAIDQATTADAIKTAQDEGTTNIGKVTVPSLEDAKNAAIKVVEDALTAQTEVINKADNLSDTEKQALIDQATEAANAAKDKINTAKTNDGAAQAGQDGKTAIEKVVPTSLDDAKTAANQVVEEALNKKLAEIKAATNLTDDEKTKLESDVNSAANTAKENIAKVKTNDAAAQAGQDGATAINNIKVPADSAVKQAAKDAIDAAAKTKDAAIDTSTLTDEEKASLKKEVSNAVKVAKDAIDGATTDSAVTTAKDNGVTAIDGIEVPSESTAKADAKKAVAEAAEAKNNAIDASNLTDEEKAALKKEVSDAQTAANTAIDNATTDTAVTDAQNDGVNAINDIKVPTNSDAKDKATADLNTAVENAKNAIDQDSNLTDNQKQAAKDKIDSDAKTAQKAINNAKTNDDVKQAVADGTLAIDKDVANAVIDSAVAGKKDEISKSPLTDEEKTALNNEVDQKAQDAKDAINTATTPEVVTTAQENGIKNITDISVPTESAAKEAAKKAVADAATAKNNAIDASNLTDEEKAALKKEVSDAQTAADNAIDTATTNTAVTEAQTNGVNAINDIKVPTNSDAKEKATADLNTAVENAKNAIDQDGNLTDEEKQAAKGQIDSDAKTAQDAINNAKTDNDVNNAVNSGKVAIDKDVANAAIDNAVAGKLKEIQDPLTTEEKQTYTDLINSEANNAKQNIANATTAEEVTTAQTNGVDAINKIEVPTTSTVKNDAIKAIDKALQDKTDAIINASNLNSDEKTDLINQANDAANTAKNNIINATTDADVNTAQTNGEKAIADVAIPNLSDVKKEGIDLVNKALDAKTDEIINASNLSKDEKQNLINDATKAATDAINNINQAKTNDDAKAATNTGVQNIENVTIPSLDDAKKNANQAIDDALNSKKTEINNASNLSDSEKTDLINKANDAAATAKKNVENATTNDAARDAANAGIDNIKGITFTSLEDAKNAANAAIDNALANKTAEIKKASNLSTDEKQDLINQANTAAQTAKDNINNATTNDAVTEAQNKGIEDIANVNVPSLDQVKQDAINAIKQVQDAKNKQIAAASNLSADEQKALTDQVDQIANDAIAKINDSSTTTNDGVNLIRDNAIKQITDLFIPTLDGAQKDAINAIENAKNSKLNDIHNTSHLNDQEKQDLIDQVNKAADDATKAINGATTNDAVKSAETTGLDNINNITIPSIADKQQAAIEELNKARDSKISDINNATDLTTDEKDRLKDQVQNEYSNAVSNVTNATTDEAVTTAKDAGVKAIDAVVIPTHSDTKDQAKKDITDAADDAKKTIDQDSHLTDDQKQAAKDQIDSDAKKAQDAIDNAKTDKDIDDAINNGKVAIDKDVANAAIDDAAAAKKEEISKASLTDEEKHKLVDEVDQKAQTAKDAINDATTPEKVTDAQTNGVNDINGIKVPTNSDTKDQAKKDITDVADDAKKAIDQDSHLTDDQKQAAKDQIDSDAKKAQDAIDNAKTDKDVDDAINNGKVAIDKDVANAAIDDAAAAKKEEISKAPLTTDEAKELNNLVDQEAKAAKEAINNANTASDVDKAKNSGVDTINKISVPTTSTAKDEANKAIDDALANKTKEITDATNLSDQEKQNLIDQANQEATKAKESIKNATSDEAVKKATDTGVDAIANVTVPNLDDAKNNASQVIDDVLKQKEDEINNAAHLTDQEKQDLINKAQDAAKEAKDKINQATTNDDVAKERDTGVEKIGNIVVPSLDEAKNNATKAIDEALADKTKQIADATNLSDQEKNDLIKQITGIADKAKDKIRNDTTDAEISNDEKDAINNIVNTEIPGLNDHKNNAQTSLDEARSTKLNEINKASNLTTDEKNDLIQKVNDEYNKALENINNATTNDEVDKAAADGVTNILNIHVPSLDEKKQNSVDALNEVREAKKQEISKASNLSQDEKDKLIKQVDQIADNAINEIKGADNDQAAKAAEEKGIQNILDVKVPSLDEVKTNAKQAIADALESKTNEINSATNLDPATKQDLINQAKDEADKAIKNIEAATNNDEALDASDKGVKNINDIKVPSLDSAIDSALNAIQAELTKKLDEINKATYLSQTQRDDLTSKANQAAETAINAINAAKTNTAVQEAAQAGVDNIRAITVPAQNIDDNTSSDNTQTALDTAKSQAIDAINQALAKKTNEINSATHLSTSEKNELINKANAIADQAKANINNATNEGEVTLAKNNGIAAINAIAIPSISNAKSDALSDIDKAANAKNEEINRANLTPSEKEALRNELNRIVSEAKANINKAGTLQDVQAAKENGIIAINAIVVNAKSADNAIVINGDKSAQTVQNQAKSTSNKSNKIQESAKNQLPQTGKSNDVAAAVGGAVAAMTGLISLLGSRKKKED